MSSPEPGHPVWKDLILGKKIVQFEFLAAKIFLGTAQRKYQQDPGAISDLAKELCSLFQKNITLPSVQNDLKKIS